MGSFNCTGFHSRLPITCGDDIFVILGLHMSPQYLGKYAFDPMTFAPGVEFTPVALPIFCQYGDCRHVENIVRDHNVETIERILGMPIETVINQCDDGSEASVKMSGIVNESLGLTPGEYLLTFTFDHRFIYDEISSLKLPWDWENSYQMTLEYSDISSGLGITKCSESYKRLLEVAETLPEGEEKNRLIEIILKNRYSTRELDAPFHEYMLKAGWGYSVANLNPKHVGTSIFRYNEAFSGELLLSFYRSYPDVLFRPELKDPLLDFMNFYMAMRYHNWPVTLSLYAGQEERYGDIAPLYRKMAEWVENHR